MEAHPTETPGSSESGVSALTGLVGYSWKVHRLSSRLQRIQMAIELRKRVAVTREQLLRTHHLCL